MEELRDYDVAANQFYKDLNLKGLPLLSWDFFQSHMDGLFKSSEDLLQLAQLARENHWTTNAHLEEQLMGKKYVIVVTNTKLEIVHATHNIFLMNGYRPTEVIGQKPKMFQGKDTCKETTRYIATAILNKAPFETSLINYKKDGSVYNCWIKGEPIFDKTGEVVNFIAFEREIA